ncbi:hypothetical protein SDC9_108819 [bioreactor metagenome]|uniref:Uncharacterized protein n=1 Tax=bioreactor metagenome TaxID=1076179 RepID=A0A645B951_9ZZZZ
MHFLGYSVTTTNNIKPRTNNKMAHKIDSVIIINEG